MKPLSNATQLPGSGIRRMFDLAGSKRDVISFVLGEPDFTTPRHIIEATQKALDEGKTHYTHNAGILELREAISKHLLEHDGLLYDPDGEILVSTGAMEVIYLCFAALLNPGDEVLITNPCYANYYGQIAMNHGVPVPVPVREEDGFNFTYQGMKEYITSKTKAILLNSPCNPTGSVAGLQTMEDVAAIAREYDLYVIYDAVYKHIIYDGNRYYNMAAFDGMRCRTLYVDSFSKTYAMTGWRLGYMAGPREIVSLLPKLHEFMPSCVSTFSQYGAIEALKNGAGDIDAMCGEYAKRRKALLKEIEGIGGISCRAPGGAFYVFLNIQETGLGSQEFAERLLEEYAVVVAPGNAFGSQGEGYVRLSYATSVENIHAGMGRIKKFVESLKVNF